MYNSFNEYFNELLKNDKEDLDTKKRALATELGMLKRTYSPDNEYSEEYPEAERDCETSAVRFYKEEPIEMTDSEYEQLKKYISKKRAVKKNPLVIIIKVIAILTALSGIISCISFLGINLPNVGAFTADVYISLVTSLLNTIIRAVLYWGFAEIIRLLDNIHSKINN